MLNSKEEKRRNALEVVGNAEARRQKSGVTTDPQCIDDRTESGSSRRSVLKRSGLGMVGASALFDKFGIGSFDSPTRIVTARGGRNSEPRSTKKVPQKWVNHQQAVRSATEALRTALEDTPFVGSVAIAPSDRMTDGVYYSQPEISVRPNANAAQIASLPESLEAAGVTGSSDLVISDVDVRRMNGEFTLGSVDCYRNETDSPFPGGLFIKDTQSGSYGFGTAGFRVFDDTAQYLYTANHVLDEGSCKVGTTKVYDANSNYIGEVVDGHKTHDWCVIERSGGGYGSTIKYEEDEVEVNGWVTENGIDSLQGDTNAIRQQGVISGYQTGTVKGDLASFSDARGCVKMFGSAVKLGFPDLAREGDSGGPYWWPNSDGNFALTTHTGFEPGDGTYSGCNADGKKGNPAYGYPVWRVFNNTDYGIS